MDTPSIIRQRRKRARPCCSKTMAKATLMTSLLWLVAFTGPHPSSVKAFVLTTNDRGHRVALNKSQPQQLTCAPTLSTTSSSSSLFTSTLADLGPSQMDNPLLSTEERPEDVLDLANLPLLLLPNDDRQAAAIATASTTAKILIPDEEEVLEWAHRYTSVEALREHFGTNHNKLWGDLQASTARRLYKTLLPRALLALSKLGKVQPQDLAPLAYQARLAAKLYARERCTVPARIAATLFDGFRQWIKYGKFQAHGMTYDQLWEKYAEKILHETGVYHHHDDDEDDEECDFFHHSDGEDLSEQVCRKILERACASNERVDALALKGQDLSDETQLEPQQRQLLEQIRSQLEEDMYQLLLPPGASTPHHRDQKVEMPELHGRTGTRDRGKLRLVKQRLTKPRRFWKLRKAQRDLADSQKLRKRAKGKAWLSKSFNLDSDSETDDETDVEDGEELMP